jgi:hypothetical protein
VTVVITCILKCLFFFREFCVNAGPDLRGGRGAALISWGRATESRVLLLFW